MLIYPMTAGCNFDEVLRVPDSMQLTPGDNVVVSPAMSDADVKHKFPSGFKPILPV